MTWSRIIPCVSSRAQIPSEELERLLFTVPVSFGLYKRHNLCQTNSSGLFVFDKGKSAARRGRKVMGLRARERVGEINADCQTAEGIDLLQSVFFAEG